MLNRHANFQHIDLKVPLFARGGISEDLKSIVIIPSDTVHHSFFAYLPCPSSNLVYRSLESTLECPLHLWLPKRFLCLSCTLKATQFDEHKIHRKKHALTNIVIHCIAESRLDVITKQIILAIVIIPRGTIINNKFLSFFSFFFFFFLMHEILPKACKGIKGQCHISWQNQRYKTKLWNMNCQNEVKNTHCRQRISRNLE